MERSRSESVDISSELKQGVSRKTKEKESKKVSKKPEKKNLHDQFQSESGVNAFVKFSDLVFFYNGETHSYFYGEG